MANVVLWTRQFAAMTKSTVVQETWFATQTIQRLPLVFYPTPMTLKLPKISIEFSRKKEAIFIQIFFFCISLRNIYYSFSAHMPRQEERKISP